MKTYSVIVERTVVERGTIFIEASTTEQAEACAQWMVELVLRLGIAGQWDGIYWEREADEPAVDTDATEQTEEKPLWKATGRGSETVRTEHEKQLRRRYQQEDLDHLRNQAMSLEIFIKRQQEREGGTGTSEVADTDDDKPE